jgi:transposase-like protein
LAQAKLTKPNTLTHQFRLPMEPHWQCTESVCRTDLQNPQIKGNGAHLKIRGSRNTMRQRTSYPTTFNTQVVQKCLGPDDSIASVALRHGINANLVRKWIPIYRDRQACAFPAFVPLKLETAAATPARQDVARIDISSGQRTVNVRWPISDPDGYARFIRSLSQ